MIKEKNVKTPRKIYHYCSLDTFYNIIKNQSIRLSDICKSNDSEELKILRTALYSEFLSANNSYLKLVNEHLKSFSKDDYESAYSYLNSTNGVIEKFDISRDVIENERSRYINKVWGICFSEKGDLLSQWRGYADNASGISIGFSTDYFMPLQEYILSNCDLYFRFGKVSYKADTLKEIIHQKIPFDCISCYSTETDIDELLRKCIGSAIIDGAFIKNKGFSEEKEWRLTFNALLTENKGSNLYGSLHEQFEDVPNFKIQKTDFNIRNGTLVSFVELKFLHISEAISEIIIGPKSKCTVDDIREFLIFCGLLKNREDDSITIRKSKLSFR